MTSSGFASGTGSTETSGVETVVVSRHGTVVVVVVHGTVVVVHGTVVVVHGAAVVVVHGVVMVVHGSTVDFGATQGRNRCSSQSLMVFI